MSDLLSGVLSQFGGPALSEMAKAIGSDESKTQSALQSALPALLGAMQKNATSPEGAQKLNQALEKDHDGSILDNLSGFLGGSNAGDIGGKILGHVLGDKSSALEQHVAQKSGLSSDATSNLIKMAAPILMGYLGKQKSQGGNSITDLLGGLSMDKLGAASGDGNFLTSLLDQNKDGNVMDDVLKMGTSFLGNLFKK